MLIALVGPPSAGKHTVASYLAAEHAFQPVSVTSSSSHGGSTSFPSSSSPLAPSPLVFSTPDELLEFSTRNWQNDYVTRDLRTKRDVDGFVKRPFFLLVCVDAPVGLRWRREVARCKALDRPAPTLETFISTNDSILYGYDSLAPETTFRAPTSLSPSFGNQHGLSAHSRFSEDDPANGMAESLINRLDGIRVTDDAPSSLSDMTLLTSENGTVGGEARKLSASTTKGACYPSSTGTGSATPPNPHSPAPLRIRSPPSGSPEALSPLLSLANLRISNSFLTLPSFLAHLSQLSLPSRHRLRPTWDQYFMRLASLASLRSNCMKRRVGAVLVRNYRVISTGYNGTPRGLTNCNEGGCPRCNRTRKEDIESDGQGASLISAGKDAAGPGRAVRQAAGQNLDECLCLHAEENALLEAGRERVGGEGSVLYCNTCPCLTCSVKIVQTGVREVVFSLGYKMDSASANVFREAGVRLRQFSAEEGN